MPFTDRADGGRQLATRLEPWRADAVVVLAPLNDDTRGLIGAAELAAMRDGALLVNAARGPVVDTDALLAEVTTARLRAVLDVTDPEPLPVEHPFWTHPRVRLTPHIASATRPETAVDRVLDNLRRHRAGDDSARLPLLRSIAGIAAALRNTG